MCYHPSMHVQYACKYVGTIHRRVIAVENEIFIIYLAETQRISMHFQCVRTHTHCSAHALHARAQVYHTRYTIIFIIAIESYSYYIQCMFTSLPVCTKTYHVLPTSTHMHGCENLDDLILLLFPLNCFDSDDFK